VTPPALRRGASRAGYRVLHGAEAAPFELSVGSLGEAARAAVALMREGRHNVRVKIPDGEVLDFDAFQQAIVHRTLRDR